MFISDRVLIQRYMAVSSAKSLSLDLACSGRSFMYAKKIMGPSTESCGIPEETGIVLELVLLVTTDSFLLSKKSFIYVLIIMWRTDRGGVFQLLSHKSFICC